MQLDLPRHLRPLLVLAVLGAGPLLTPDALAQGKAKHHALRKDGQPERHMQLAVLGHFGPGYGDVSLGGGALFSFPVMRTSGGWNDALHVELGPLFTATFDSSVGAYMQIAAGARYDVHVFPTLIAYIAARLGPVFALADRRIPGGFGDERRVGFYGGAAAGVIWSFADKVALRGEGFGGSLGYAGLLAGLTFMF